jgi:uncharacterized SAM-dependent methyltransferase
MKAKQSADLVGETPPYTVHRSRQQMLRDVRQGLTTMPKELSPKYFYDERGSELFEEITQLPEYYLTRAERLLLEKKIPEIVASVRPCSLVELVQAARPRRESFSTQCARADAPNVTCRST